MLDLTKIEKMAESSTAQELYAALVCQKKFNTFNGQKVIEDLYGNGKLWASFLFIRPIYAPDPTSLGLRNLVDTLSTLASQRLQLEGEAKVRRNPQTLANLSIADTLYVLALERDSYISPLLDLAHQWQADSIKVINGKSDRYDPLLKRQLTKKLNGALPCMSGEQSGGIVISYWWDRSGIERSHLI